MNSRDVTLGSLKSLVHSEVSRFYCSTSGWNRINQLLKEHKFQVVCASTGGWIALPSSTQDVVVTRNVAEVVYLGDRLAVYCYDGTEGAVRPVIQSNYGLGSCPTAAMMMVPELADEMLLYRFGSPVIFSQWLQQNGFRLLHDLALGEDWLLHYDVHLACGKTRAELLNPLGLADCTTTESALGMLWNF